MKGLKKRPKMNRSKHVNRWVILSLSLLFTLVTGILPLPGQNNEPQHDALTYDVAVSAQIIPIYAVDKKGNPVFDLKQEDIELYINGKLQKLLFFSNYQVEEEIETAKPAKRESLLKRKPFDPGP